MEVRPAGSDNIKAVKSWQQKQRLAQVEIILHVEPSQLPHTCFDNPKDIWDKLEKVYLSCGFATCLSLKCFLSMWKDEAQAMHAWIAAIQSVINELADASTEVSEDDISVILTLGLPPSYENFVIMLDTTPDNQFTLDLVITCLLNEESHETMVDMDNMHNDNILYEKGKERKGTFSVTNVEKGATCVVNAQTRPTTICLPVMTHQNQKGIRE